MDVQSNAAGTDLMRVVFRSDASTEIGTGHVMRCLTLADALHKHGAECCFICRAHQGHLLEYIVQRGHEAIALPTAVTGTETPTDSPHVAWLGVDWGTDANQTRDALKPQTVDWLVVDHYALDRCWESALRSNCHHLMVIDDLADRSHECDLLLDQNLGRKEQDYYTLLNPETRLLVGPKYALLRPEFAYWRTRSLLRREKPALKSLLITMGGVDQVNATGKVLNALKGCAIPKNIKVTVVMGPNAPWLENVKQQATQMLWSVRVLVGVNNMAQLMTESDLAIGASGSTSWERCCLGLPTIQIVLAKNQEAIAAALDSAGAAVVVGIDDLLSVLPKQLSEIGTMTRLQCMSAIASNVADGTGAEAVASVLLEDFNENHIAVQ